MTGSDDGEPFRRGESRVYCTACPRPQLVEQLWPRVVFIQDNLASAILFYAQESGLDREGFLFPSRKGGHITKQRVGQIVKGRARRARLQRNVHAHLFRHGYAINFLKYSGRLDALQEQLGHGDINTTRIYLRLSDDDLQREVSKIQF